MEGENHEEISVRLTIFRHCFFSSHLHAAGDYTIIDLGTMGNDSSFTRSIYNHGVIVSDTGIADINESGQNVGDCNVIGSFGFFRNSSFLLTGREVIDLGLAGAKAINDMGQIVGNHYLYGYPSSGRSRFLPVAGKTDRHDLNDLIVTKIVYADLEVVDINIAGQIVGGATIKGAEHAALLNPAD